MNSILVQSLLDPYIHPIFGTPCSRAARDLALKGIREGRVSKRKERWMYVDWSKSDFEISGELKVHTSTVQYQRRKLHGPPTYRSQPIRPRQIQPEIGPRQRDDARLALRRGVASGMVARKPCAVCDNPKSEGHHFDYTKPLEVIWLCRKHHGAIHAHANTVSSRS